MIRSEFRLNKQIVIWYHNNSDFDTTILFKCPFCTTPSLKIPCKHFCYSIKLDTYLCDDKIIKIQSDIDKALSNRSRIHNYQSAQC